MLNLINLKDTTKGRDMFEKNNLRLEILSGISTDGVPAMINKDKGVIKLLIDKIE